MQSRRVTTHSNNLPPPPHFLPFQVHAEALGKVNDRHDEHCELCDELKRKERIKSKHEHKPFVVTLLVSLLLVSTQSLVEIKPITDFEQRENFIPTQLRPLISPQSEVILIFQK